MKFEDLVWDIVEGSPYLETTVKVNDKDIKIVKLDDDSFKVTVDGVDTEANIDILALLIQDEKYIDTIKEKKDDSYGLKIKTEIFLKNKEGKEKWESEWKLNKDNNYMLEIPHHPTGGTFQLIKRGEDDFLMRVLTDEYPNRKFDETNRYDALGNFAYALDLDILEFMKYVKGADEQNSNENEANTEDVSHTEE